MKSIKPIVLALSIISLVACSSTDKKAQPKLDYQSQNNKIINLEVPPDLNDPRDGDLYTLPAGTQARPDALKQVTSSRNRQVLLNVKDAHIESRGTQRWLIIQNKSASEIWSLLRAFWQESGFTIYSEEPQAGLMETEWAENRAKLPNQGLRRLFDKVGMGGLYSTSERDKFLIRMEHNETGDLAIFFTHKGLQEVGNKRSDTTTWQPRANDPSLEAAFLSRFMQYLGADNTATAMKQQIQSDKTQSSEYAKLDRNSLLVFGSAERNINRIASALDRIGLTVQQFVSERNMFVVRPAPNESDMVAQAAADTHKKGLLKRWFNKKETEAVIKSRQAAQMFVALEALDNGQRVVLLDSFGKPYTGENATKWLNELYRELH